MTIDARALRVASKARLWSERTARVLDQQRQSRRELRRHTDDRHNPVFLEYRVDGMNTSLDFCKFVVKAVMEGFLVPGDVLVCDNAKVHKSPFMTIELNAWLAQHAITIVYLPTYSPELNPCEMVFGFVKNNLRISRDSNNTFFDEVNERFHQITTEMLERFYMHCLDQ